MPRRLRQDRPDFSPRMAWVVWLDDDRLHLSGDAGPAALPAYIETGVPSVLIETVPIARGDAVERVEVPTPGGILEIDVGRVPLVITTP
ncbi:MAG TPA: hypothetical protein VFV53_03590 [Candidatus Limnocylindrales bacterium]|nr:hypothetical protein [Candidatus Limnocylindrales bacterium]